MVRKPRTISIQIERVEDVGPFTCGISDIKVVHAGLNGSQAHAASVVVTTMVTGGPAVARDFQKGVVSLLRDVAANMAKEAAIDAPAPEVASLEPQEHTEPKES